MSASFSIVIEGKGTFTASIADPEASVTVGTNTPASFTAEVAPVGPAGATGATGPAGVVTATAPITYNSGTQTVAMDTAYFVRSPATAATDGQIIAWDDATARPLWIDNAARTLFSTVRNETGATLTAGTVVYISGAAGNKALVTKAQANSEASSSRTFGVIATAISNNQNGTAIVAGELGKLDTTAYAEGATLYLSPTTAGTFTTTKPTAPNHIVYIGTVTRVHANQGTIEVRIQNGSELDEMADVLFTSKANNDLLVYESSSSLWKNKSFSTLDLATQSWVTSQGYLTAPYNPFDQTLNTSSTVQFAGVSISGLTGYVVGMSSSSVYAINTTSGQKGAFLNGDGLNLLGSGSGIIFADSTTQTTAATTPDLTPYATLASPTFTGNPIAPTPTAGDNDTSIATTAFVTTAVAAQTVDIQTFGGPASSGSFTWTKPAGAKMVHVRAIGGGGGGCGGAVQSTAIVRAGGAGGGGGASSYFIIPADELGSTVAINVGAGGAGSAGRSTVGSATTASSGGVSSFGNYRAFNGNGGTSATGGGGFVGTLFNILNSGGAAAGGNSSTTTGVAGGGNTSGSFLALGGGGGGGAGAGATTAVAGGAGGSRTNSTVPASYSATLAGGSGGTTAGVAATNGTNGDVAYAGGTGGGGGFYRTAQATGNGANGGWPGGGGGGGGASDNTYLSGSGGNGANGVVIVTTYF